MITAMGMDFLTYMLKAAVLTAAFLLIYLLLLKRETFHKVNRYIILASFILSYLLPLCHIRIHRDNPIDETTQTVPTYINNTPVQKDYSATQYTETPPASMSSGSTVTNSSVPSTTQSLPLDNSERTRISTSGLITILFWTYLTGLAVMLIWKLIPIIHVYRIIRNGRTVKADDGYTLIGTQFPVSPFNWMQYIVLNENDLTHADPSIIEHEKAHITSHHSADLILVDLFSLPQWFNPAVWIMRNELSLVHEFQADATVLKLDYDRKQYQHMLLNRTMAGMKTWNFANGLLYTKTLEHRIDMMKSKPSGRSKIWKVAAIPVVAGLYLALTSSVVYDADDSLNYIYTDYTDNGTTVFKNEGYSFRILSSDNRIVELIAADKRIEFPSTVIIPGKISFDGQNYSVKKIGNAAFKGHSEIHKVRIPSEVVCVAASAFKDCINLKRIIIPSSVMYVGYNAFSNTAWLDSQPDKMVYAGKVAYLYKGECPSQVKLKNRTKAVSSICFNDKKTLEKVIIPSKVKIVGGFAGSGLRTIEIPKSVRIIEDGAFMNCKNLHEISLNEGIISIQSSVFSNCTSLHTIRIPDSVYEIGMGSFSDCISLNDVLLSDNIKEIPLFLFMNCTSLTNIHLPSRLKAIREGAFENCPSLSEFTVPSEVTEIEVCALPETKENLTITCLPDNPPAITAGTASDLQSQLSKLWSQTNSKLIVQEKSLESYRLADGWSCFNYITFQRE